MAYATLRKIAIIYHLNSILILRNRFFVERCQRAYSSCRNLRDRYRFLGHEKSSFFYHSDFVSSVSILIKEKGEGDREEAPALNEDLCWALTTLKTDKRSSGTRNAATLLEACTASRLSTLARNRIEDI